MRNQVTYLLLLALTLIFSNPSLSQADNKRSVKIGILTDLSGKAAYLGNQTRVAAELLARELNVDGVSRVTFVLSDHGLDTAKAVTETQKLLNVDNVDAVFSNFSGTSRAANPVVKNSGKLFIYTAAAVEPVTTNPLAFKSYLDYILGCEQLAKSWQSSGVQTVGVLKAEAEFGDLCLSGVLKVYPQAVVTTYKPGEDVKTQVLSLKSKKVQAIVNAGYEGDMGNLLKVIRELQFTVRVGANEDIFTEKLIAEYKAELAQASAFGMPRPTQKFSDAIKAADPKNMTGSLDQAAMSYLHLKQLEAVLETCNEGDVPCQREALLKSPADSSFGFIAWRENRQANFTWVVSTFKNGTFQPNP